MQRLRLLPIALLATLVAACSGGGGGGGHSVAVPIVPPVTPAWHVPGCSSVTGATPVTFTADGGLNRVPIQTPAANYFTHGLAALGAGSTLAAIVGTSSGQDPAGLYVSIDAGCSWKPSGHTFHNDDATQFELGELGGYAYAWSSGNDTLYAIERNGLASPLKLPDSRWSSRGPSSNHLVTTAAVWSAGHVSFDGGNLWLLAQGIPADWVAQEVAIGYDGHTVWLPKIFLHPYDSNVVYLTYTSRANGTSYLYRYDASLDQLRKQQWPSSEGGVWTLAFNPADAGLIYLGLGAVD